MDNIYNGYFGDLRNYVEATPKEGIEEKQIRNFKDLVFNTKKLQRLIKEHKGKEIKKPNVKKKADGENQNQTTSREMDPMQKV